MSDDTAPDDAAEQIGYHSLGGGGVPFGMDADDRFHWLLERRRLIAAGDMAPPPAPRRIRVLNADGCIVQRNEDELNDSDGPTER